MVNLKNNHGLKVSLYVSNITGYPMIVTTLDSEWYDENPSCDYDTLCDYAKDMDAMFRNMLESMQHESTPLSNDTMLESMVARVLKAGFTYNFSANVD